MIRSAGAFLVNSEPEAWKNNIRGVFGEAGILWLERLPQLLNECAVQYQLEILPPFPNLSFNYVTPVRRSDGTDAVLKLGVPNPELHSEIAALRVYDGRKAVRVLESDAEQGILLLEHIMPGTPLTTLASDEHDDEATTICSLLMRDLWRLVPPGFALQTVADWSKSFGVIRERFGGGSGVLPHALLDKAERIYAEYLAAPTGQVLLHGDLHHDNILLDTDDHWLAIDPKGLIGEPEYEVGSNLRNLWQDRYTIANPKRTIERRIEIFADILGFDKERLRNWGFAQTMLSAWWTIEDGGDDFQKEITLAELLN